MARLHTEHEAALTSPARARPRAPTRWRHPFDSARGTIALGVLLTVVLVLALRLLHG